MELDPKKFGKVVVLMGGQNSEREVSLMSGNEVIKGLQQYNIDVHAIDVGNDIVAKLIEGNFDRAFIALHGVYGEDGTIQGLLESLKIPYTGSGVAASALAMDKIRSKWLLQRLGIPTLPFIIANGEINFADVKKQLKLPLVVKPNTQGSSVGVTKVTNEIEFNKAIEAAREFDSDIFIEPWIEHQELTVGILDEEALPVIRIATPVGFYDYHAKYFSDDTQYHIPSGLSEAKEEEVKRIALEAYHALGCKHLGRVDLVMDEDGKVDVLEVNTVPGLTSHSLVPKAAKACGIDFAELSLRILAQTL